MREITKYKVTYYSGTWNCWVTNFKYFDDLDSAITFRRANNNEAEIEKVTIVELPSTSWYEVVDWEKKRVTRDNTWKITWSEPYNHQDWSYQNMCVSPWYCRCSQ